jgi:VCBS repeat-containing protein
MSKNLLSQNRQNKTVRRSALEHGLRILLMLAFLVSLLSVQPVRPAQAAVGILTAWAHPSTGIAGPYTITDATFSCSAGSNRLLVAVVTAEVGTTALGNVTATKGTGINFSTAVATGIATKGIVWIGYLLESQIAANTNSIVITNNSGVAWTNSDVFLACYAGVNQSQPIITSGTWTTQGSSGTTSALSIPVVNGGTVIYSNARTSGSANPNLVTITNVIPADPAWTKPFESSNSGYFYTVAQKMVTADTTPVTSTVTWPSQPYANAAISLNPTAALNSTTAGTATVTAAGTTSIAISMPYTDDANTNNTYSVDYKLTSDSTWTNWVTGAAHVASPYATTIIGLTGGTSYDVRLTYNDADGVTGPNPQMTSGVITYYTLTVNTDGNGTVALNPTGGSYAPNTVVTLTATGNSGYLFKEWSGDLTGSTNPATITMIGNKTVSAAFSAAECTVVSLPVAADTYMNSGTTKGSYNYGGAPTIQLNPYYQGGGSDQYRAPLLRWDVSSVPSEATVTAASLTFYVTTGETAYTYSLYNMRRAWVEGTNNDAAGTGASWNYYGAGTGSWGTAGAANITSDRENTNLWGAIASDFGVTGNKTFDLNSSGLAAIKGWVTTSANNFGLTIQNYSGTATGSWIAASRENISGYTVPTLNITYCVPIVPTITTSSTMTAFSAPVGTPSAQQSYTVSGKYLTNDIVITPPVDFEISLTGGAGFTPTNPITLDKGSGTIAATTIYVRLNPTTATSYSANITHVSSGATSRNVAVTGSSVPAITATSSMTAFSATTGMYSAEKTYTVSGVNLTGNIAIAAPADFEISTTSGSEFGSSLSLTQSAGVVGTTTIYVRFLRTVAGTSNGNINHDSTGAIQKTVAVSGTATDPTITVTSSMSAFHQTVGSPSPEQTYTISGSYLKGDVTVTAPTDFEISKTTGTGWASTLTFSPTSGTLATTTVYVRLNRSTLGSSSGNISHTSTDATTRNVAVSGTADNNICVTSRISASTDDVEERNDTGAVDVNGDGSTGRMSLQTYREYTTGVGTLNWWGLRFLNINVPPGATITSADIKFRANVTSGSTDAGMTLWGQLLVNPGTFSSTANNVTSRTRTFASTTWAMPAWTDGSDYLSGDLTNVVQEIVNQTGWVANQPLVIIGQNTVSQNRAAISWDTTTTGPTLAPLLTVCYSVNSPTITVNSTMTSFNSPVGTPSTQQSYTVSGSNLTNDIVITPPTDFEISLTGGAGFTATNPITLDKGSGTIAATTIYVRLNPTTATTYSANITHVSSGATSRNVAVTGSSVPAITATSTMTAFSAPVGVDSAQQSYTVSGINLTDAIVVTAPADFRVSTTSGGPYSSSISLTPTNGVVTTTTIYVVFNRATAGTSSGDITHTASGATTRNVAVSGTALIYYTLTTNATNGTVTLNPTGGSYPSGTVVTLTATANSGFMFSGWSGALSGTTTPTTLTMDGNKSVTAAFTAATCTTVNLEAVDDLYMSGANTTYNYGASTTLKVSTGSTAKRGDLWRWDVSSISSAATVTNASISVYVSTAGTQVYNLYNMRRDWVEGTGAGSASGDGATWLTTNGTTTWAANGAADTATDRFDTTLWDATTSSFASNGSKTVSLNNSGITVVQGWISGTTPNYGLTVQNYTSTTTSDMQYASAEDTTNPGATLNVTSCIPAGATHTLTAGNDGHGTVTLNPAGGTYAENTVVTLTPVPSSGFAFDHWSGTNFADLTDNGNGTWSITMTENKTVSANFEALPNLPVLVQPADHATGVALAPTLEVTASDPDSATLSVSFYGRPKTAAVSDFTIIVLPDTQKYADPDNFPDRVATFNSQTQWIVDQESARNIVFVTHVGDIVENNYENGWKAADNAFDTLDTAGVPYSVGFGQSNNDGSTCTTCLHEIYFGISRFAGKPWYGGHYGDTNRSNYSLFSVSGMDFILINLMSDPTSAELDWADALLKTYSSRRAIVESHNQLTVADGWSNQAVFTALKDNPNLFFMLSGHLSSAADGVGKRTDLGDSGQNIYSVLQDYQSYTNINNGYLHIYRFSPANDRIYMTVYSPTLAAYNTAADSTLEFAYTMPDAPAYTLIGTVPGVSSGSHASLPWPGRDPNTEYEWYAVVSDGKGSTTGSTWSFTTGSANHAPVADDQSVSTNEDIAKSITLTATDVDSDPLTWTVGTPGHGALSGTAPNLTYTPSANYYGPDSFTFHVNDGKVDSLVATVSITVATVNDGPVVSDIPGQTVAEGSTFISINLDDYVSDADNSDSELTWTCSGNSALTVTINGTACGGGGGGSGVTAVGHNASITIPNANWNGSETITFRATDPGSLWDDDAATFTVTAVNDAPVANEDTYSMGEDDTLSVAAPGVLGNDTDVENDPLRVMVVDHSTTNVGVQITITSGALVTLNSDGSLSYNPNGKFDYLKVGETENDSFTYKCTDDTNTSDAANVVIGIHGANDAPVANAQSVTATEDTAKAIVLSATDADSDPLTWTVGTPGHGVLSGTAPNLTYTPAANYNGPDSFTFHVNDTHVDSNTATVSITVSAVNDAPVASAQSVTTAEDTAKAIVLSATDADNDPLTYSIVDSPDHGALSGTAPDLTYTPAANYNGSDSFTFKANDTHVDSNVATVSITILAGGDAPEVGDIPGQTISEGSSFTTIFLDDYVTDADNSKSELTWTCSGNSALTVTIDGTPCGGGGGGGILSAVGHVATITIPNPDWFGSETITFRATDPDTLYDEDAAAFKVTNVNDVPVADAQSVTTAEDTAKAITLTASDADSDPLTWTVGTPAHGALTGTAPNLTYTPAANYNGPDSFSFHVNDTHVDSASATVTITVTPVNDAPVLNPIGNKNATVGVQLAFTATATNVDTDTLTFSLADGSGGHVPSGALIGSSSGAFTWTPSAPGTATFDACVSDSPPGGSALSDCETITVTVSKPSFTHSFSLVVGWNLVSFDLHPDDTGIAAVLASLAGHYNLVYAWDGSGASSGDGNWLKYAPNGPSYANTLLSLDEKMGFWIRVTTADVLEITGVKPDSTAISLYTNAGGWNLVGYPSAKSAALPAILSANGVGTDFSLVYAYHASDTTDTWKLFDRTAPSWSNDLTELAAGWGYWIKVSATHPWTVAYVEN